MPYMATVILIPKRMREQVYKSLVNRMPNIQNKKDPDVSIRAFSYSCPNSRNNEISYCNLKAIGILKGTFTALPLCLPGVIFGSF